MITSPSAEGLDERERLCRVNVVPLVTTSPTEVLVWTRPSKSGLIASGPLGTTAARSSTARVPPSVQASDAGAAPVTVTATPGSVLVYAPLSAAAAASITARKAPSRAGRQRADRRRIPGDGVKALAPLEGDKPERRDGEHIAERTREHLIAFEWPWAMLVPECPPRPPLTDTDSVTASAPHSSRGSSTLISVSVLLAGADG